MSDEKKRHEKERGETVQPDESFEDLLGYVLQTRGFDFTRYKRTSLKRRIYARMQAVGVEEYDNYQDYLEVHPEEFAHLFDSILINVTSFFRDVEAWDYLKDEVVKRIAEEAAGARDIRIWSAGCSSGEEPYSLAMVFAEALGEEQFQKLVKIYATDVDDDALRKARLATYGEREIEPVGEERRDRFFLRQKDRYVFKPELRRTLVFGRHNLLSDAPISKLDLLVCRNTLMYFNAEGQERALSIFGFALNQTGYLFLGKAEMLLTRTRMFNPVELKYRVFQKAVRDMAGEKYPALLPAARHFPDTGDLAARYRNEVFERSVDPQVVLDRDTRVVLANRHAQSCFEMTDNDEGTPLGELKLGRPDLYQVVKEAKDTRQAKRLTGFRWSDESGADDCFDVTVTPFNDNAGELLGLGMAFNKVTDTQAKADELKHARQELATAYEELQSSNEELQTTNEELQSSNEELETTNEELQSTNEELETMNEELQSTNEEMQATNDELRERTGELEETNSFLASILVSLRAGVAIVDKDMRVKSWNKMSEDLWGVRAEEAEGTSLFSLDIGLPVGQLNDSLRRIIRGVEEQARVRLRAVNRRGRKIDVMVTMTALTDAGRRTSGAIILMEQEGEAE